MYGSATLATVLSTPASAVRDHRAAGIRARCGTWRVLGRWPAGLIARRRGGPKDSSRQIIRHGYDKHNSFLIHARASRLLRPDAVLLEKSFCFFLQKKKGTYLLFSSASHALKREVVPASRNRRDCDAAEAAAAE